MTAAEQATMNKIQVKQATMEANQNNMTNDIRELKSDVKEVKDLVKQIADNQIGFREEVQKSYISKGVIKWLIGLSISLATLAVFIWDHISRR